MPYESSEKKDLFSILHRLNPTFAAAWQLITHHVDSRTSFVTQLYGHENSAINLIVDSIKDAIVNLSEKTLARNIADDIIIDINNSLMSPQVSSRRYSHFFYTALTSALDKKSCLPLSNDDHAQQDDEYSSSECSEDDSEDIDDLDDSKRTALGYHEVSKKGTTRSNLDATLSSKHFVRQIVSIMRSIDSSKRLIIVLRRFDLLIKASMRLLYGLLNFVSDRETSLILITTTHAPTVPLEKRLCSRYKPFLLPIILSCPNIYSNLLEIACHASPGRRKLLLGLFKDPITLKICDSGWASHLLTTSLSDRQVADNLGTSPALQHFVNRFDPLLHFYSEFHIPGIFEALYLSAQKALCTTAEHSRISIDWLESLKSIVHQTFVVIVAIFLSLEDISYSKSIRTSSKNHARDSRNLSLLTDYAWLKCFSEHKSNCFSVEYLLQNILPLEGGVIEVTQKTLNNKTHSFRWFFSELSYQAVMNKIQYPDSHEKLSPPRVSDLEWMRVITWLIKEGHLLHPLCPSMLTLTCPPYHCIYMIRKRIGRLLNLLNEDERNFRELCFTSITNANSSASSLKVIESIFYEVRSEVEDISRKYEDRIINLLQTRNVR